MRFAVLSLREKLERVERSELERALRASEWKLVPTAGRLGMGVSSLQRLLERHPEVDAARRRKLEARRAKPASPEAAEE